MEKQNPLLIILSILFAIGGVILTGRSASPLPTLLFIGLIVLIIIIFAKMKKKEEE